MTAPATSNTQPSPKTDLPELIQGVARSFSLSLLWLPAQVRGTVGLGYLLARASDTIADSIDEGARGPDGQMARRRALTALLTSIQNAALDPPERSGPLRDLTKAIGPVPKPSEQVLLEKLDELIDALLSLPPPDRQCIAKVCDTIVSGQMLDLQRFDHGEGELHALQTSAEVTDYTWRVAGCVGHFWSEVCEAHVPAWRTLTLERMKDLGHCYGMGLQRLNLLRDTRQDLALGRCYWPQDELAQVGLSPAALSEVVLNGDVARLNAMRPLIALWKDQARADLSQGVAYALAVRPWRLRWACALPALLGLRTLQMIEQAGVLSLTKTVKVPRLWVYGLMARLTLGGLRHNRLRDLALSLGATPADLQGHGDNGTMHP